MTWSLPDTCISCVHYEQAGYKHDEHAPTKDRYGFDSEQKAQRYGQCQKLQCSVFWNESKCNSYQAEEGIETHHCHPRPCALEPHQEQLI